MEPIVGVCWLGFRRDEGFVGYIGGDVDMQNQLDEIIIYQKVATAVAERG